MLHFTYCDKPLTQELLQGDVLRRTPELEAILQEVHPHYFEKAENQYFLVLTQSCDLVRREGGECKARYVSIAPIRPIEVVMDRYLAAQRRPDLPADATVFTSDVEPRARQFLERLFNNNESSYFYLRKEPGRNFPDDACAFLALSVAIKTSLHYDTCVGAKVLELQEIFRAKLGWLVGQLYSRIGTEDWERTALGLEIERLMEQVSVWIPSKAYRDVKNAIRAWRAANPGQEPTAEVVIEIVRNLPKRKDKVVDRLLKIASEQGMIGDEAMETRIGNLLRSDPVLSKLIGD